MLSDNSNSCDTLHHHQPSRSQQKVLQEKDPNLLAPCSPLVSPLVRPGPAPPGQPRITNQQLDAGSSSYLDPGTGGDECVSLIPESFFLYSPSPAMAGQGGNTPVVPGSDLFNQMPSEVVLLVFKWLPKCTLAKSARVCKRWLRLSQDESLWRRLDLGLATVPAGVVGQEMTRGCCVLRLARATISPPVFVSHVTGETTFPPALGDTSLDTSVTMLETSSRLQYLDLSMASISPGCLEQVLSGCSMLRNLALEMCSLTDTACHAIAGNRNLNVLHLGQVQGLTLEGISTILERCRNLTELNLGWTELSQETVARVCGLLGPGLRRLCLAGHRDSLLDSHLAVMLDNCPNLRELDVSDCAQLSPASLSLVQEKCVYLESLSTSRCYGIAPSTYLMLANSPTLLYLNVFGLLREPAMVELKERLQGIEINKFMFTSVARPTVGIKRTSIWNLRVR